MPMRNKKTVVHLCRVPFSVFFVIRVFIVLLLFCLVVKWTTNFTTSKLCYSDSFSVFPVCTDDLLSTYSSIVYFV